MLPPLPVIPYEVGEMVYCAEDLFNDGGMPGADEDAILAPAGARGVVVQSGYAEEDESQMIYLVRFEDASGELGPPIGCLPEELTQETPTATA